MLFDFGDLPAEVSKKFSGDFVGRVTPVPIPNTEVKPVGADGTARETAWESRKSPGLFEKVRSSLSSGLFYIAHLACEIPQGSQPFFPDTDSIICWIKATRWLKAT